MYRLQDVPQLDNLNDAMETSLPELEDGIWGRIFAFATDDGEYDDVAMDEQRYYDRVLLRVNKTRKSLVLVSKRFHVSSSQPACI